MRRYRNCFSSSVCFLFFACAGNPSKDVLNPVQGEPKVAEEAQPQGSETYEKLRSILDKLGYEGIGLNLERESTLKFLCEVFSDAKAAKHQIKYVYTGLSLEYDVKHESLTVGGTKDIRTVLDFIQKKVPSRKD